MDKIVKNLDQDYILNTLKDLISVESITSSEADGEKKAAILLIDKMKELGIETNFNEIVPGRANAVGTIAKSNGPILALNGHLDVVPADKKSWNSNPFITYFENGKIFGRGTADMKGAIAAMLGAVKYILDNDLKINGKLLLSFVCDEEKTNLGTINFLENYSKIDYAVIGEPTGLDINIAHRGVVRMTIKVSGQSGHASEPDKSENAIYKMNEIINLIRKYSEEISSKKHHLLPSPTIAVTKIKGGTNDNVIPGECQITVDRRMIPGEDSSSVLKELKTLLAGYDVDFKKTVDLIPGEIDEKNDFVFKLKELYKDYFRSAPDLDYFRASCEQSLFLNKGIDTVIFGPGDISQAHTRNEYIEINDLMQAAGYYVYIIQELLK